MFLHDIVGQMSIEEAKKTVNELSTEKLAAYKTAAGKAATAADKAGDFEKGHKRFKGIVKATNKQFANDMKKYQDVKENDFRNRERNAGLEHEINNIEIQINGRIWKIFPGEGPEGSQAWFNQRQRMKAMCDRKTAQSGKKWAMYITGARPTAEGVEWRGTRDGKAEHDRTDHTLDDALEYIKTNYPSVKTYRVRRAEPGFRANLKPNEFNKSNAHVNDVDSAVDYLQLKKNPMMSGSKQFTPSIGMSWMTMENPSTGLAIIYYQDRGMGWDEITLGGKDATKHKQIRQVFRDAGIIPTPKPKQGVAEGFNSKQEVINHFVKQGKTAAQGASAWERGWRGNTPKKKPSPFDPGYKFKDVDNKRYGDVDEDSSDFMANDSTSPVGGNMKNEDSWSSDNTPWGGKDPFTSDQHEMVENAEELQVGDEVIVSGHVEFQGATGVIEAFGMGKRFVVVNLYNYGKHSFHSSDVSANDYADSDEEEARMYDNDPDARDWENKIAESLRPGEYHVWAVHFDDGTTGKIRVPSDEVSGEDIAKHYAKQGKTVVKIDYNWEVQGGNMYESKKR